ncbi:MAG: amidohydrolase family protein [Saprospiraceae bacterium]|nr:amidohydrolase family protein [Saprospiraceae bacterium]
MNHLIQGAQVVRPNHVEAVDVLIEDGIIKKIGSPKDVGKYSIIDGSGKYLLPGFIDIHNHGAAGFDFSFGNYDMAHEIFQNHEEAFHLGLKNALDHYRSHGVTKVLPTSMAAPLDQLKQSFSHLSSFLQTFPQYANMVHGINLEGTFLLDPYYAGAQNPDHFYPLTSSEVKEVMQAANDMIKIINIPPDHGAMALPIIKGLKRDGLVVAGGHTGAYADEFGAAVDAGLSLAVHFLNGPSRSFSKSFRGGGAVEVMLQADEVYLEIICDGYHVHPAYVRDAIARKGPDRIIMITDSMFANGLRKLKSFELLGLHGTVSENGEYLQPVGKKDTLFGSVLCSDVGFQHVLHWLTTEMTGVWHRKHEALSLEAALVQCCRFFSTNPAKLLGLDHPPTGLGTGSIREGMAADLLLARISNEGAYTFQLDQIITN